MLRKRSGSLQAGELHSDQMSRKHGIQFHAQTPDILPDVEYNADEINGYIEAYDLPRYPGFDRAPDSLKDNNGGYDVFSLVAHGEDSLRKDEKFFLKILLRYIRYQIEKNAEINNLRIAIPLHMGSESSGHYVAFCIQADKIHQRSAKKICEDLKEHHKDTTDEQLLSDRLFTNRLKRLYAEVKADFFDSTPLSYLDESRNQNRKKELIATLQAGFRHIQLRHSMPIQQTNGAYIDDDNEDVGHGCGPITVEHCMAFLQVGLPVQLLNDDIISRAEFINRTRRNQFERSRLHRAQTEEKNIRIPIGGKIGGRANCFISIEKLKQLLREHAQDQELDIVAETINNDINLQIYTSKEINLFNGANKKQDNYGRTYYEVKVNASDNNPKGLFELRVQVDGRQKSFDISHAFTVKEISEFRERASCASPAVAQSTSIQQDPVLIAIRDVNKYLKKRAGETSKFFATLTDSYSGADYYERRSSWKNILEAINAHINNSRESTREDLLGFILYEAERFKPAFLKFSKRREYYTHLMNLHGAIKQNQSYDFKQIVADVVSYHAIYTEMDLYKRVTERYIDNSFAFFTSKKEKTCAARVELEHELYDAHYEMLSLKDKKDFPDTKTEHLSEYDNMRRFG